MVVEANDYIKQFLRYWQFSVCIRRAPKRK